jgi:hypothetical protein
MGFAALNPSYKATSPPADERPGVFRQNRRFVQIHLRRERRHQHRDLGDVGGRQDAYFQRIIRVPRARSKRPGDSVAPGWMTRRRCCACARPWRADACANPPYAFCLPLSIDAVFCFNSQSSSAQCAVNSALLPSFLSSIARRIGMTCSGIKLFIKRWAPAAARTRESERPSNSASAALPCEVVSSDAAMSFIRRTNFFSPSVSSSSS